MTNHFHLLLEVTTKPVSKIMQVLLQRQAQYINRRYSYRGHLFGGRFWASVCPRDEYVLAVLRYIHLNPVRAGLAQAPELYRWSSHRVYLGVTGAPWVSTILLDLFSPDRESAIVEYSRFVRDGMVECLN